MNAGIEAVVFDFGNVLTLPPLEHEFAALVELCGLERRTFDTQYTARRREYDRGTIDGPRYWSLVMRSAGAPPAPELVRRLIEQDIVAWSRINEPVLAWARELRKAGFRTGILSNMPADILRGMRKRFPWIEEFEVTVFSCELGTVKPEAEIYRACLGGLALPGSRVLFLDDIQENVEGARKEGMKALLFRNMKDVQRRLAELGWRRGQVAPLRERRP
jgi:putative hydrolase of the HAD superfamily